MNTRPASLRQHVHQPGRLAVLVTCLLLIALVLPGGATGSAQAAPVAQEPPPSRLPYDGAFDLPQRQGAAPHGEVAPALTAPEYVSWSKLVFQSLRNEHDWEIYSAQGDGSAQANISNHSSMDLHPRLNRGATRVVFASNRHGGYDLFAMNPDGGGQTRLVDGAGDDVYPAWSPDGSRIVFQAYRDGQAEIYVANADGSGQTRLTTHGDYDGQPAWSPDGSQIAFVRRESGSYRIWAMNANGSNQRPLSNQPSSENPAWSPDGSQIAYDADGNGDGWQELWLMNADGSNQRQVYDPPESQTDAWVGDWSPDGRYVAFTRISFVYYQGQWYWTAGYLDAWDSAQPWSTSRLSGNGADWNPDWASTDGQAPTSNVQPLPAQSPAPFTVRWTGSDTGGSGLKNYDVQIREGAGGTWTNWKTNTTDTSASYTGVGGRVYYFRARARDHAGNVEAWPAAHDAMTTVEANPPETAVLALPAFSRNGLVVQWDGSDPGDSGILSFDVQYRQGNGAWTDWRMGVTETSASFSGTAGAEYRFRARARDRAQNLEAWPATADAATTLYTWAVRGSVTDNRGAPVVGMATTTTPAAFHTAASDGEGAYAAHVSAVAASYSASWSKTGYGALPSTAFAPNPDAAIDVVLPPADNVVQNWGFENGSSSWQFGGNLAAAVTTSDRHSGAAAVLLGSPGGPLQQVRTISDALHPSDVGFDSVMDSAGIIHSIWVQADLRLMYSQRSPSGNWSSSLPLPMPPGIDSWFPHLSADNAGTTHLAISTSGGVYYSNNQAGAGWTTPELIPGTTPSGVPPAMAFGLDGTIKVVAPGPADYYQDVYFVQRRPGGDWTQARKIATTYGTDVNFHLAVDPSGLAHLLWEGGDESGYGDFLYASEQADGTWSMPINLSQDDSQPGDATMVIDSQGAVHVLWSKDSIYYRMRPARGSWAGRTTLASGEQGDVTLAADEGRLIYAVWGDPNLRQVRYARRTNGIWSSPVSISPATASPSFSSPRIAVDRQQRLHVLWVQFQMLNEWSIHYMKQDDTGGWQQEVVVFENNDNIGMPRFLLAANEAPNAVWYARVNGAYHVQSAGPEFVQATGEATLSQPIYVPATEATPTLSFLHHFGTEFPSDSRLEVAIDDGAAATVVFSANSGGDTWEHQWVDLTPWAGRSVTLRFKVIEAAGGAHAWAYIDEVTVGSARPDVWVSLPGQLTAARDRTFDTTITYGNRGGVTASNGRVTLQLPPQLSFVSADPPPTATTPTLRWDVGVLAGHSGPQTIRVTLRMAASATGGDTLTTTASIASDTAELEQANNTAAGAVYVGSVLYLPVLMR